MLNTLQHNGKFPTYFTVQDLQNVLSASRSIKDTTRSIHFISGQIATMRINKHYTPTFCCTRNETAAILIVYQHKHISSTSTFPVIFFFLIQFSPDDF